jgi:hypothetical protein
MKLGIGLGIGIGFGLQNIFNNFISNLTLLFKKPIQDDRQLRKRIEELVNQLKKSQEQTPFPFQMQRRRASR